MKLLPIALLLVAVAPVSVSADGAAERIERANLLRKLLEDVPPVGVRGSGPRPELPAARLEIERQSAAERVLIDRFQDGQWRQLLGFQRASAHREAPAPPPPAAGLLFERGQRARDLSIQIQRQDFEYRQYNRR